jgi:hypothetical protein
MKIRKTPVQWTPILPYTWSDGIIQFKIPGKVWWENLPFNSKIRIYKRNPTKALTSPGAYLKSGAVSFVVRKHPVITAVQPATGYYGQKVNLTGNGFAHIGATLREEIFTTGSSAGYGYSTYVLLKCSNDVYRPRSYPKSDFAVGPGGNWRQDEIAFLAGGKSRMSRLLDVKAGSFVVEPQLYEAAWQIYVVTDYFRDDADLIYNYGALGNAAVGGRADPDNDKLGLDLCTQSLYDLCEYQDPLNSKCGDPTWNFLDGPDGNSPLVYPLGTVPLPAYDDTVGDFLLHREISAGGPEFTVIDVPTITAVTKKLYGNGICKIWGFNFGIDQGSQVIQVGNKAFTNIKSIDASSRRMRFWSTTKIKFKIPKFGAVAATYPKVKYIRIMRPGSPDVYSNGGLALRRINRVKLLGPAAP